MFSKFALLATVLSNVDGSRYLRGPGLNATVVPVHVPVANFNMSKSLTIIPDKSVSLYSMKHWAKLVEVSNSSKTEL